MQQIREKMDLIDLDEDTIDAEVLRFTGCHNGQLPFRAWCFQSLRSFARQLSRSPRSSWDDIGGLEKVKQELQETVQYPSSIRTNSSKYGMQPSKGVLFYGPPGTGKTMLAKAIASETQANFISIKVRPGSLS